MKDRTFGRGVGSIYSPPMTTEPDRWDESRNAEQSAEAAPRQGATRSREIRRPPTASARQEVCDRYLLRPLPWLKHDEFEFRDSDTVDHSKIGQGPISRRAPHSWSTPLKVELQMRPARPAITPPKDAEQRRFRMQT